MTESVDFGIINTDNGLDIDFEASYNQEGAIFNMLFANGRKLTNNNKTALLYKGGCIGDTLVSDDNITGSLIYEYIQKYQGRELERYVTEEINRKIDKLILTKTIESATLKNVVAQGRTLYITLSYIYKGKQQFLDIKI